LEGNRRLEGKLSADTQLFDALPAEVRACIRQVDRDYFANSVPEG
jgi:hypothetical protein